MKYFLCCLIIVCTSVSFGYLRKDPWLTQEARSFLTQYLQKIDNPKILEFGSGGSTIWFAQRTKNLISYEHIEYYYNLVNSYLQEHSPNPVDLRLRKFPYYTEIENFPDNYFDLVLVDARDRLECCIRSLRIIKPGGVLMLDNSERPNLQPIFSKLKDWTCTTTYQPFPDEYGYTYDGWQTTWWVKNKK